MMARGLDRIVEKPLSERANEQPLLLKRRDLLKMFGFTVLTLAGVGFAGCSSKVSESIEFKSQNSSQSDYRLIYPENSKPVSDNVIPHIEEIGKKYFEVWAPGDLTCYIKGRKEDIPSTEVRPGMIITGFSTENGYNWVVGDIDLAWNGEKGVDAFKLEYIKELASDINFVNKYMGVYGALFIRGPVGNKAYANFTFIERGGGKVASFVYVQDLNDPENYERYAFHSKEKLDKMWIEMLSHPISYKPAHNPKNWYKIPDRFYEVKVLGLQHSS